MGVRDPEKGIGLGALGGHADPVVPRLNRIMDAAKKRIEDEHLTLAGEAAEYTHAQTQILMAGIEVVMQLRDQTIKYEKAMAQMAIAVQGMAEEVKNLAAHVENRGEQIRQSVEKTAAATERAAVCIEALAKGGRS